MSDRMDIETLRDLVARRQPVSGTVTRLAPDTAPKPAADGTRRITFVYSDETIDREYDRVLASGWVLDAYRKNPIAIFGHDAHKAENVVGKSVNLRVEAGKLIGDIEFAPASINPNAEMVYQLYKGGFLNAVSVGFRPLDLKIVDNDDRPGGLDFVRQELMEISCVPIPCNGNALAIARSKGIDIRPLQRLSQATAGRAAQAVRSLDGQRATSALVSAGKSIPDPPEISPFDPRGMSRGDIAQEFTILSRWIDLAKSATGAFSARQQKQFDEVNGRYETIWRFRFG